MLYGLNTNLGHNSIVYMLESQIQYVKDAIANLRAAPGTSFEVKSDGGESGLSCQVHFAK
jgi:hypothetical protein